MITHSEIIAMLNLFKQSGMERDSNSKEIECYLDSNKNNDICDRKNFNGHITASAIVYNKSEDKILLLYHRTLEKWLQPGGHIDASDASPLHSALREVYEETSIGSDDIMIKSECNGNLLIHVNSHFIPANAKKSEPAHFHHDLMFFFELKAKDNSILICDSESLSFRWFTPEDASLYCGIRNLKDRMTLFTELHQYIW